MKEIEGKLAAKGLKIALVASRFNSFLVEQLVKGAAASLGFVVGVEWFTLIDQAVTGRFFQGVGGESYNTGLLSVTDRPYRDLWTRMRDANLQGIGTLK